MNKLLKHALLLSGFVLAQHAYAFTFETESMQGSLNTTLSVGGGLRLLDPSCSRIGDPSFCNGNVDVDGWSNGDDGNLNYNKGSLFSAYTKATSELLVKLPDSYTVMARASYLYDAGAKNTDRTNLSGSAQDLVVHNFRLLDLWVSKELVIKDQRARVRFGNQVINWGESLFGLGGINATNAYDVNRLLTPGTQLKEAVLPAPMISLASTIGSQWNVEAYYQFAWNSYWFPPVGSYFSVSDIFDRGKQSAYFNANNFNVGGLDPQAAAATGQPEGVPIQVLHNQRPKSNGQYGISAHFRPESIDVDFGFYVMNYHDKTPVLQYVDFGGAAQWKYLEDRKMYGVSANFGLGDWALGWELSYRPKDAIALSGCYVPGGEADANISTGAKTCEAYKNLERYQSHFTGLLSMTPANYPGLLKLLGANAATFLGEAVFTRFSGFKNEYISTTSDGISVSQIPQAGYWFWTRPGANGYQVATPAGTAFSWGYTFDFSWTYDGTVIPGWQMTPGMTFFHAVKGRTPTFLANYMEGAKSTNMYILFTQNPAKWQAGINYAKYFGGSTSFDQPYADRDFLGAFISRNF